MPRCLVDRLSGRPSWNCLAHSFGLVRRRRRPLPSACRRIFSNRIPRVASASSHVGNRREGRSGVALDGPPALLSGRPLVSIRHKAARALMRYGELSGKGIRLVVAGTQRSGRLCSRAGRFFSIPAPLSADYRTLARACIARAATMPSSLPRAIVLTVARAAMQFASDERQAGIARKLKRPSIDDARWLRERAVRLYASALLVADTEPAYAARLTAQAIGLADRAASIEERLRNGRHQAPRRVRRNRQSPQYRRLVGN